MHSFEELSRIFAIDDTSESGLVRKSTGRRVGSKHHSGRWHLAHEGKNYQVHRLVWFLHYGTWPKGQIDHLDGNPMNNAVSNLRDVDGYTNMQNRKSAGVSWHKASRKWMAQIMVRGKHFYLGLYEDYELAELVHREAKSKLHPGAQPWTLEEA